MAVGELAGVGVAGVVGTRGAGARSDLAALTVGAALALLEGSPLGDTLLETAADMGVVASAVDEVARVEWWQGLMGSGDSRVGMGNGGCDGRGGESQHTEKDAGAHVGGGAGAAAAAAVVVVVVEVVATGGEGGGWRKMSSVDGEGRRRAGCACRRETKLMRRAVTALSEWPEVFRAQGHCVRAAPEGGHHSTGRGAAGWWGRRRVSHRVDRVAFGARARCDQPAGCRVRGEGLRREPAGAGTQLPRESNWRWPVASVGGAGVARQGQGPRLGSAQGRQ